MGVLQLRHLPRRMNHDATGMLSKPLICFSHFGHRERGRTTLMPLGTRAMTTFKKLPMHDPTKKVHARITAATTGGSVLGGSRKMRRSSITWSFGRSRGFAA